jgi:glycine/D-amino acid oxidase-like deaminating enzyme
MSTFDSSSTNNTLDIIIAGAGIIGTSTAYYLTKHHSDQVNSITIVDPTGSIAPAASGKAGGFLALDWNDYSPVGPLARRSFELHQEIARDFGYEKIQYRRLTCASISVDESGQKKPRGKKLEGVEWAADSVNASGYV